MTLPSDALPLPKFLRLETATAEDVAARMTAQDGIFGITPGMSAEDFAALGIPKSMTAKGHKVAVTLKDDAVSKVVYAYMGPRGIGRALQAALSERYGEPSGTSMRWSTDSGRLVLKSKYRAGPGYWEVSLELTAAPAKKKKAAPRQAKPKAPDTAESLATALTGHLHDIEGDVYDDGAIDRVVVSPKGSGWTVQVLAKGTGGSASFTWTDPLRGADGKLDPGLFEALVDAGGRAIEA